MPCNMRLSLLAYSQCLICPIIPSSFQSSFSFGGHNRFPYKWVVSTMKFVS